MAANWRFRVEALLLFTLVFLIPFIFGLIMLSQMTRGNVVVAIIGLIFVAIALGMLFLTLGTYVRSTISMMKRKVKGLLRKKLLQ